MIGHLKIDGQELRKLSEYEIAEDPLWADDAGRNSMDGRYSGTLIGYFTKINLNFTSMSVDDMAHNQALLKRGFFDVTYQDKKSKEMITEKFYNDSGISSSVARYDGDRYGEYSVSLVAVERRGA